MKEIVIDNTLCIKCRDCVEICPENLFFFTSYCHRRKA
ncbi:MAG: 4Fe-4S binding protein [Candidatus Lokiarchaeota archaeon]|nr:4Fe-4S binding protein [Candidatus Lokiarchaeota archaeon]